MDVVIDRRSATAETRRRGEIGLSLWSNADIGSRYSRKAVRAPGSNANSPTRIGWIRCARCTGKVVANYPARLVTLCDRARALAAMGRE